MIVSALSAPVTASKADWQAAGTWLGFTPAADDLNAYNQCQGTVQRQFRNGYVLEYITKTISKPNPGFEDHPEYLEERRRHNELAGRLVAIHRLRVSSRRLQSILSPDELKKLQDMWAQDGKRCRWSVAFPIVESYEVVGKPLAEDVFAPADYTALYQRPSAVLRELSDEQRASIAMLELEPLVASNARIGIEDEFPLAEASQIDRRTQQLIDRDLNDRALEGQSEERRAKLRRRAAWLADKFILQRQRAGTLACDHCTFDPQGRNDLRGVRPRSLLDVHHRFPLEEGVRYTTVADFALLCPTCHRIEHAMLALKSRTAIRP
jgi:5-methylcytosine-specific restriction protein A